MAFVEARSPSVNLDGRGAWVEEYGVPPTSVDSAVMVPKASPRPVELFSLREFTGDVRRAAQRQSRKRSYVAFENTTRPVSKG